MINAKDAFKAVGKNSLLWIKGPHLTKEQAGGDKQYAVAQALQKLLPYGNFGHYYLRFVVADGVAIPFWEEDGVQFRPNLAFICDGEDDNSFATLDDLVNWDGKNFHTFMANNGFMLSLR